jgi:UDP:flavonoid glycosyltransferase YjiC (YdhE family)
MTIGSRGDMQPFLALSLGLMGRGHSVLLAGPPEWRRIAEGRGIAYRELGLDISGLLSSPEAARYADGKGILKFLAIRKRVAGELMLKAGRDARAILGECDIAVYKNALSMVPGLCRLAKKPCVEVGLLPFSPTSADSGLLLGGRNLGGPLNRLATGIISGSVYTMSRASLDALAAETPGLDGFRAAYRAAKRNRKKAPLLYAFSSAVYAKPADWGDNVMLTGYWFLPEDPGWKPSPALEKFLGAGPKPVYFGFGSMPSLDPAACLAAIRSALSRLGLRGVVNKGWGGLGAGSGQEDSLYFIDEVPHSWLFPRVAAAVHHGGAGTTAAALRAGIPSVVVPHMADQPFWARRLRELGAAPAPIPARDFSAARLERALAAALAGGAMRAAAESAARKLASEDGATRAAEEVERWAEGC